ncbi:MAG: hypothetical protein WBS15_05640 [Mycobacterium sp.]
MVTHSLCRAAAAPDESRPMMRGLKTWAELHMDEVLANRATYDTRTA